MEAAIAEMGIERLSELTADRFIQYRASRDVSPSTNNNLLMYMKSTINTLINSGMMQCKNPLATVKKIKIRDTELAYLTTEEIAELLKSCRASRNPHVELITKICLSTGARWGEAESLSIHQVRNGRIHLRGEGTKSGKNRSIPIAEDLEEEITHHARPGRRQLFDASISAFRKAMERTGIETPKGQMSHILRHTFASHFMMAGGNILVLQQILGHSSLTMTMRYAHFAPDHLQDAITKNPLTRARKEKMKRN